VYESEAATNPRNLAAAEWTYVHDHRVEPANVELIATFVATVLLYSLVSKRIERTVLTAPMLFTAAGAAAFLLPQGMREFALDRSGFLLIAEIGLVLTLFTDASRITLRSLSGNRNLPVRLLSIGMLLTIALGLAAALLVFGGMSIWDAGILAAVLAPTDAGLGAVIVNSQQVPERIREALNVEAGLNDGLSVPFLMLFIALAAQTADPAHVVLGRFLLEQLGYGAAIGVGVGGVGGWLLAGAIRRDWVSEPMRQLGVVALPLGCVLLSEATAASMFIAAFVAGLAVQIRLRDAGKHSVEFTEDWGQLFDFFVFFLFGLVVARDFAHFSTAHFLYALLSLTVVRMLPVALALVGTRLAAATIAFVGWFGPRGLASVVLGLVYLDAAGVGSDAATIRSTVIATVLVSIVAHGVSAVPLMNAYARVLARLPADAAERAAPPG
jgi:NhaP-type Na+/H+ or K+/H+ antiporter